MLRTRQEELLETRLESLRRSLTTTDRVLSGQNVSLQFGRNEFAEHPAYSVGSNITIELGKIANLGSNSALVEILGLNYHELAHVRYSIAQYQFSSMMTLHKRFVEAYRVLEEARVETLLAAKYAKMKKYFAYPVIKYFVQDKNAWPTAFLFTYGRRYLPLNVRENFRNVFESEYGGSKEFAEIIDKYRVLAFTASDRIRTGALLINEFAQLLDDNVIPSLNTHQDDVVEQNEDGEDIPIKRYSDEETDQEAQDAAQQAKEQDEKEEQGEDGSGFNDEGDEDGESEDSSGEGDSEGEPDQGDDGDEPEDSGSGKDQEDDDSEPDSEQSSSDGAGDGDQESDGESGGGEEQEDDSTDSAGASGQAAGEGTPSEASPSSGEHRKPTKEELEQQREDLADQMADILDEVLDNEEIRSDVDNLKSAMDDEAGLSSSLRRRDKNLEKNLQPVTAKMLVEADKLKEVLRQIWAQMEPGWMYGLSEGNRIDMQRASLAQSADDYDSIYADWQEGQQENSGLEVVIVADESWSMCEPVPAQPGETRAYPVDKATVVSRQIWELKWALQEVDAHVTVISFSDDSYTMYDRQDVVTTKGYARLVPDSGTDPTEALIEAKRIFVVSENPNKLLVVISDGEWNEYAVLNCAEILDQTIGVTKVSAVIDTEGKNYQLALAHKFDVVRRTSRSIFEVVADAVTRIVERNLNS